MSKGTGTVRGYRVEARVSPHIGVGVWGPPQVGPHTWLTETWREISYTHVSREHGVKNDLHCRIAEDRGVLSYAAAEALMAWVASHHHAVECRLVAVEFAFSYEEKELGVVMN